MSRKFYYRWFRKLWQPRTDLTIAQACVIGIVAALSAVFLKFGASWLGTWRVDVALMLPTWLVLPIIGVCFGFLAGFLVQKFAPEAMYSGIPQVKASLANVPMNLSWRVGIVKLIGTILTLGSGLRLGRQDPTVHVGAALAGGMSRMIPTSPDRRRQMIATGAGAGLAAAFNAPIAGVLFVIENLLQDLSGLTLGTAIIASFIGGVVSRLLGGGSLVLNLELTEFATTFSLLEIPFYLILGGLAGLLAASFHKGLLASFHLYRKLGLRLSLRVAIAGGISGIALAMLPTIYWDNIGLREYIITGQGNLRFATLVFFTEFTLSLVAFGSGAPGGLFAPCLIMGSALGHIVGWCEFQVFGLGSPSTYALAGMGAFFSGVSKVPMTAIVIVFEITRDFNVVLPLMITCLTSYLISDKVVPGSLTNKLLKLNGINLTPTPTVPEGILNQLTAKDVMQRGVASLGVEMNLRAVIQKFSQSVHQGFPVTEDGEIVGIVTHSDLLKIHARNLSLDASIREIMTNRPITVSPKYRLNNLLYLLDRYQISRLPIVEGRRILGLVTRDDIIKAQAKYLNYERTNVKIQPNYVVYQTCQPSTGLGRLLLVVNNSHTAKGLLEIASAIAGDRRYEIECLQVLVVSPERSPSQTPVNSKKYRRLLQELENQGKHWHIPIHTQIRVAHDPSTAILETIPDRYINLLVMEWNQSHVTDTILSQANCEVILVKLATSNLKNSPPATSNVTLPNSFSRCLLLTAGGPNSQAAMQFLPALARWDNSPEIFLTQVFKPSENQPDMTQIVKFVNNLMRQRKFTPKVVAVPVPGDSVAQAAINLVKTDMYDVVVLGASREGMMKQVVRGNIPRAIATAVDSTVILVRAISSDS